MSAKSKMDALHSVASSEWYSPSMLIDAAREWMGSIDLDPASCFAANSHVGATNYYTQRDDGLAQRWFGGVFLNPPSPPRIWWERAVTAFLDREAESIFFVAYSIEVLEQSQVWADGPKPSKKNPNPSPGLPPMTAFSVCIPRRRIRYLCTASDAIVKTREKISNRAAALLKGPDMRKAKQIETDMRALRRLLDELKALSPGTLVPGDQPTHASAIVGIGNDHDGFAKACRNIGAVMRGTGRVPVGRAAA